MNSPGACGVAGGGTGDGDGAFHKGSAAGFGADELKIRVNSPCPCGGGGGAAGGAGGNAGSAGFALGDENICVKLPGWLAAGGGGAAGAGVTGILSIDTGLKTLASSSDGLDTGDEPTGSGVFSACSMRVKSPCPEAAEAGAGAGGAGAGTAGAADIGVGACAITSAEGVENMVDAEDAGGALGTGAETGAADGVFRDWNIAVNPPDELAAGAAGALGGGGAITDSDTGGAEANAGGGAGTGAGGAGTVAADGPADDVFSD